MRLFSSMPVSPAVTPEPKPELRLWMPDTALPSASTTQKYVVSPTAASGSASARSLARAMSIAAAHSSA